jgi:hypothetical protein
MRLPHATGDGRDGPRGARGMAQVDVESETIVAIAVTTSPQGLARTRRSRCRRWLPAFVRPSNLEPMRAIGEGRELWRVEIVLWTREPEADQVQALERGRGRDEAER